MPSAKTIKCPAEGCGFDIPVHQAFCRHHWLMLPKKLHWKLCAYVGKNPQKWVDAMKEAKETLVQLERGELSHAAN